MVFHSESNYDYHFILKELAEEFSQPTHDALGKSSEVPLMVLTSGIYKGPSEDFQGTNTKIDDLMKNLFFRSNSPCITYLFLFLTGRANIQKF